MSGKKQQTAAGLFFSMLLRAAVIILGLAIVAFGAFFVMQALKGNTANRISECQPCAVSCYRRS